ncbi:phytoene/squalene synthase family protein [Flexivirga caeni]|uniref:Phytoene/squalene synthase family protein n=1 Tax=Flexivirga caeni TaxID=2294115 RepID=A0A3M9MH06_9MICO|nr:phytoene/squalene synthase family protein [Flexivirga caeni]RNI24427.1 phytoene/squalene synthase family protein [Flexivirga caeni]
MSELAAAYRACQEINATHGKSFYRATSLLPPRRRRHVWALYAVARRSDDLVDRPAAGADPSAQLHEWETAVLDVLGGGAPRDPVLLALQDTVTRFAIPATLFEEFFVSMRQDLTTFRYPHWTDLRAYMRGSAAAIGEMTAPILGAGADALPHAAALGEAFQLTNFIRDIAEDWQRGRIYLPLEDLRACGLSEDQLGTDVATGTSSSALRRVVARETARARELYAAAGPGIGEVDPAARACLRAASALYAAILDEIERSGSEVCRGRTVVPGARRGVAVTRSLLPGPSYRHH